MIDLSHLTEEEQEAILTVLRRDADLKRAEEERVRKLEKILPSSQPDVKLKYLTGEWFYEAKSRRHNDKIHGSEIILAAMKQGKTSSADVSPRHDRSRTPGSRGSDIVAPPKPARCFETSEPQEKSDAEKENRFSGVRSPRPARLNPFNRASLTVFDHPENMQDLLIQQDQDLQETETVSSLKNPPAGDSSQTSGGSITSESSSVGFRPVPKKRTLLLSRSHLQTNNQLWSDAQVGPAEVVPAPRRRHQRGSGSNPSSCFKSNDETPQKDVFNMSLQPTKAGEEVSLQLLCDSSQISSKPGLEREQNVTRDRPAVFSGTEVNAGRESATWNKDGDDLNQRERAASNVFNVQETIGRGEELSSTQSSADPDPPVSYDLKFIDKSTQQRQNQKSIFKLSTQTTSPTGEDEDSIAKVLDWFDRSTDSNDWLEAEDKPKASESVDKHIPVRKSGGKDSFDGASKTKRRLRRGSLELTERQQDVWIDTRGKVPVQDVGNNTEENQPIQISNLKSSWEHSNTGPKVLFSKPERPGLNSDAPSDPERYSERVSHDKSISDLSENREKQLLINQLNDYQQEETMKFNLNQSRNDDSAHLKLLPSYEVSNRRAEISHITRPDASTVDYQSDFGVKPMLLSESKQLLRQDLLSNTHPEPGTDCQTISLDSEKLLLSGPYLDHEQDGSEEQVAIKLQVHRHSSEDEDKDKRLSGGVSNKEWTNSQASWQQESTAEKIKQLKSFWEQELNKPLFYTGKPKSQARLNKRFTKSEFDLTSVGNESGSDEDGGNKNTNLSVLPLNQRLDKMSPSLGASRAQFNTLREFWDEATSDSRASVTPEKLKSPKRKEPQQAQLLSQELRSADPELYPFSSAVVTKLYPSQKSRPKSPLDRATGSKVQNDTSYMLDESGQKRLSKRISKESSQEEKSLKLQSSKEIRSPKNRKDSFSFSSSRGNSLRRATSMFALSVDGDKDQNQLKMEVNPIQFQSRKPRQKTDKGSQSRRSSNESETLAPLARAFVPSDYCHYLGMTDSGSSHAAFTPPTKDHALEVKSGYKLDLGGPLGASTPTSSEDRPVRKTHKTSQYPAWADYTESDTGHESSISSASETWSNSRNCSNRVNDDDLNPVRKALWRAEAQPRNLAKSLEDITAPPRQERRADQSIDLRRSSNTSTTPSPNSSLFSDPDHLKKMSRSVPSFLQKEDDDVREAEGLTAGSSMTALSGSSGTASLSGSVMTMYSGDFVEVQGSVQFSINYVQKLREFHIFVAECHNLAAVDPKRNRSDPYVKSYLVPDKANLGKRKTSVKKKTLNPKFNEILRYRVRMEYLRTQTLILSVWHHDTFGKNSFLGEVDVDLSKWDSDHTQMNYLALKAKTIPLIAPINSGRGEMRLALRFLPQITHSEGLTKVLSNTGEIHIWVKECKNLPLIRATIDPYVKCFVLPDTSRKSRQKTRVLRRTADPVFNHTMVYDGIKETDLSDVCVELTVWDRDRLASSLLGGLRLGAGTGRSYGALVDWMDSGPYEVTLWDRMIASPNEWVEDVLPLRILISARRVVK